MAQKSTVPKDEGVSVTSQEESEVLHKLEVSVAAERVGRAYDSAYRNLARQAPVRGFRPGKVPRSVLERMYGASLGEQIEHTLVAETLPVAVEKVGLEPVTEPSIDARAPVSGEDFHYTVSVEVKPSVTLPELEGLPAVKPAVNVTVEEVEGELERLRQRQAPEVEEPEGTAAAQDHILFIDFVGRIDGETFEGGSGQDVRIEIGAGQFIPGFEQQLLGACAGDDREVSVTFPEDYQAEDLAGREAVFAVHVETLKTRQVPELDDDFAVDLEFDSLDALRQNVRDDLTKQRERAATAELNRTVMDSLVERTDFAVPPGLVERELDRQIHTARHRLEGQVPAEAMEGQLARWKEEWRDRAEREVREAILLEAVVAARDLQVTEEEVKARVGEMAAQQGVEPKILRQAYGDDGLERALKVQMGDEKALEFLVTRAKVEEMTDT